MLHKKLGMTITKWKDSRILQVMSTVIHSGIGEVKRGIGAKIIDVRCPNDIMMYQQNMGGVNHGDQYRVMGGGFENVLH